MAPQTSPPHDRDLAGRDLAGRDLADELLDDRRPARSSTSPSPPPRGQRRRSGRRAAFALLALALLVPLIAAGAYVGWLDRTATSNVHHEALLPSSAGNGATGSDGAAAAQAVTQGAGDDYLLIGSDARPGDAGRSDVIVLVHVPRDKKKVYLVHVPRDLYVAIPGHGKDKVNAAYAYGGAPLLVSTLQDLLDVTIDHVAKTDFAGFQAMTDAVGGVDVSVVEPSAAFPAGTRHMDGATALTYVRERKGLADGDISRGKRQESFVKALMLKGLSRGTVTNPLRFQRFVDATTQHLVLDDAMTSSEMRSSALGLRSIRGDDVVFLTAPYSGFGTSPAGASIVLPDEPRLRDLGAALATDQMGDYQP